MRIRELGGHLRDSLRGQQPRRTGSPRSRRRARRAVFAVAVVVALLVIPVGRSVGYGFADAVCAGGDCSDVLGAVPRCESLGRDRPIAAQALAYTRAAQGSPTARLVTYGDGSVDVRVQSAEFDTGAGSDGEAAVYRFTDVDEAKRWVLDHTDSTGRVVDAAAGPAQSGVYDGYLRALFGTGLLRDEGRTPRFGVTGISAAPGEQQRTAVLEDMTNSTSRQVLVPEFPMESTPALSTMAHRLGIGEYIVLTITRTASGEPSGLEIAGLGTESWSLDALRAPQSARVPFSPDVQLDGGEFVWRSYSLDLRRRSNAEAFDAAFSGPSRGTALLETGQFDRRVGAGELEFNPYVRLGDRTREDAVFVESRIRASEVGSDLSGLADRLAAHHLVDLDAPGLIADALRVSSADLSMAGSMPEDLLTCSGGMSEPSDTATENEDPDGADDASAPPVPELPGGGESAPAGSAPATSNSGG